MKLRSSDPLDSGTPGLKAWEEFRAGFAAQMLLVWLLRDVEQLAPDYTGRLRQRLDDASDLMDISTGDEVLAPLEPYDPDADGTEFDIVSREELNTIAEQLFPHGKNDPDYRYAHRGLALVGLYSVFEGFCRAMHLHPDPDVISQRLTDSRRPRLDSSTASLLKELRATRNILVHNRGIVDDHFLKQVAGSVFRVGERRLLSGQEFSRMAAAVWQAAQLLYDTARSHP